VRPERRPRAAGVSVSSCVRTQRRLDGGRAGIEGEERERQKEGLTSNTPHTHLPNRTRIQLPSPRNRRLRLPLIPVIASSCSPQHIAHATSYPIHGLSGTAITTEGIPRCLLGVEQGLADEEGGDAEGEAETEGEGGGAGEGGEEEGGHA